MEQQNRVYSGTVMHKRFLPKQHQLSMDMFMLYLDADDIDQHRIQQPYLSQEKFNWLSVYRSDYFAPEIPSLKQAVIDKVTQAWPLHTPAPAILKVFMLSQPRFLGFVFNPLSLYYCFNQQAQLCAVLAEVSNTPWNERHAYVLACNTPMENKNDSLQIEHNKTFHVSPFHPMAMKYKWRLSQPAEKLRVAIENWHLEQETKHFVAAFTFDGTPLKGGVGRLIWRFPLMSTKVMLGIYWHALRLWLKGLRFYSYPAK